MQSYQPEFDLEPTLKENQLHKSPLASTCRLCRVSGTQLKHVCYIHSLGCSLLSNRKELVHAITRMDLENILLPERSQTKGHISLDPSKTPA